MNILITGSTGFIGEHLSKALEEKYTLFYLVRPTTKVSEDNQPRCFVFDDNIEDLSAYLIKNNIIGIVHLASLYISQHNCTDIKELISSNIYLGAALLEAASKTKVEWFLNTGTIWQNYIYDSDEYCPVNLYSATKQAFIDLAKYYTETTDIKFCTLKLCDTYGPGDKRKKILSLFKEIAENGQKLDMSFGEQEIDILHINDVIEGFLKLIDLLVNKLPIKSEYKLSSGKPISLKELAGKYQLICNQKLEINWGGREYRDREVMKVWNQGETVPGWMPKIPLESGLKKFIDE